MTDSSTYNPWKKDVDDMLHDMPIIEQISQLISQLRLPYQVRIKFFFQNIESIAHFIKK